MLFIYLSVVVEIPSGKKQAMKRHQHVFKEQSSSLLPSSEGL